VLALKAVGTSGLMHEAGAGATWSRVPQLLQVPTWGASSLPGGGRRLGAPIQSPNWASSKQDDVTWWHTAHMHRRGPLEGKVKAKEQKQVQG